MVREVVTEVEINASPAHVWKVFSNFTAYPNWTDVFKYEEPPVAAGKPMAVVISMKPGSGMRFTPQVLVYDQGKELRWRGKLFNSNWWFIGEHYFQLRQTAENKTTFVHGERFTGLMVTLAAFLILPDTERGFQRFNLALKEQAEMLR